MGLIKTGDFITKSNVKIKYDIYLMSFLELKKFVDENESLSISLVKLIKEQYSTISPDLLKIDDDKFDIIKFYEASFIKYSHQKILIAKFTDPNNGLKITEIGSTVVFVNTDEETIKIFNVYILEKYRGNKLCPLIMNLVVRNLFNKKTFELDNRKTIRITLDVLEGNDVAINCYKKLGFEIDIKKGLHPYGSEKYYEMNLNFKSFLIYFTKLKIVEILEFQSQPSHLQTIKDQINILFTKI
jgi:ribosomal protein S18 acetylase RimI-like enzyme